MSVRRDLDVGRGFQISDVIEENSVVVCVVERNQVGGFYMVQTDESNPRSGRHSSIG